MRMEATLDGARHNMDLVEARLALLRTHTYTHEHTHGNKAKPTVLIQKILPEFG